MQKQQEPKLIVLLAGTAAAGGNATTSAAAGAAWLQLSPDTMHQHRLRSQQLCLVSCAAATNGLIHLCGCTNLIFKHLLCG
jgi:hypothetical protein